MRPRGSQNHPRRPRVPLERSGGGFGRVLRLSWGASERSWAGKTEEKSEKRRETRAEKREERMKIITYMRKERKKREEKREEKFGKSCEK